MYRDGYGDSGWVRVLRYLSRTFHLGIFFGVEVRVFWIALVILPLIGVLEFSRGGAPFLEVVTLTVLLTVWLYLLVWSHEMGHILAARRYGIYTPLITLSPLGGLAHLSAPAGSPRQAIVISLAGPATHLLWLAVFWPLSKVVPFDLLWPAGWTWGPVAFTLDFFVRANLFLMIFNLLPFFPMDGGRVLRALLSLKMNGNRATIWAARVGMVGAVGFGIFGLVTGGAWGGILLAIGITNFFACRQEMRAARYMAGPYGGADRREAWQEDPEAWRRTGGASAAPKREGVFARWRTRRDVRRAEREREARVQQDEDVDRILARVSEVGMGGLTRAERAVLERASRNRQRPR